jgi:hypothetical protein
VTYPTNKPTNCKTETAEACITTTTYDQTVSDGTTKTVSTRTVSECATIVGCNVKDSNEGTTTKETCTVSTTRAEKRDVPEPTPTAAVLAERAPNCPGVWADDSIIYPKNPRSPGAIVEYLKNKKFVDSTDGNKEKAWWDRTKQIQAAGFTAFFFVEGLTEPVLKDMKQVLRDHVRDAGAPNMRVKRKCFANMRFQIEGDGAFGIVAWNEEHYVNGRGTEEDPGDTVTARSEDGAFESTHSSKFRRTRRNNLAAKNASAILADAAKEESTYWELSQISVPPKGNWDSSAYISGGRYKHDVDGALGSGQTIYVVEDEVLDNPVSSNAAYSLPFPNSLGRFATCAC